MAVGISSSPAIWARPTRPYCPPRNRPGERITIRAGIHTLSSYSAHADQNGLLHFVQRIRCGAKRVRLVHGDAGAKAALRRVLAGAGVVVG